MDTVRIELLCRNKTAALLDKYFPNFVHEAAVDMPEHLAADYTNDLPHKIAREYREWLAGVWTEKAPAGSKTFDEVMNLGRSLEITDASYEPYLEDAREEAEHVTLWEKITRGNHEDVAYYKGLLKQYTEELLDTMTKDFMGDIEAL